VDQWSELPSVVRQDMGEVAPIRWRINLAIVPGERADLRNREPSKPLCVLLRFVPTI
jgi:hypothetical protein